MGLINTGLRVAGDVGLTNIGLVILSCLMLCWSSCNEGCGVNQHWSSCSGGCGVNQHWSSEALYINV